MVEELYKLQPEDFVTTYFDLLRLKENPEELGRCQKLNSSYYYNTNLSYSQMFNNLRRILKDMDLTDELFIKFKAA